MAYSEILKNSVIELLLSTKREGMDNLVDWLVATGYFVSPASVRHHSSDDGGLVRHSANVYELLAQMNKTCKCGCPDESIIIASLLHDVCKIQAYVRTQTLDGWTNNREKPAGHAKLSIDRIKQYIKLTELEEMMIRYHMGVFLIMLYLNSFYRANTDT